MLRLYGLIKQYRGAQCPPVESIPDTMGIRDTDKSRHKGGSFFYELLWITVVRRRC